MKYLGHDFNEHFECVKCKMSYFLVKKFKFFCWSYDMIIELKNEC